MPKHSPVFFFLLCLFFLFSGTVFSQITNSDFEDWEGNLLLDWHADPTCGPRDYSSVTRMTKKYKEAVPYSGTEAVLVQTNTSIRVSFTLQKKYTRLRGYYYISKDGESCGPLSAVYAVGSRSRKINDEGNLQKQLSRLETMKHSFPQRKEDWGVFEIDLTPFITLDKDGQATFTLFYVNCNADLFLDNIRLIK